MTISINALSPKKKVYPQIDKPFRCIDIYNSKAYITLWVHPFMQLKENLVEYRLVKPHL